MAKKKAATKQEEKEVVVSKKGIKTDNKRTVSQAKKNAEIQAAKEVPLEKEPSVFIVRSNLRRNGKLYTEGDILEEKLCPAISELIELNVLKVKGDNSDRGVIIEAEVVEDEPADEDVAEDVDGASEVVPEEEEEAK